MKLMKNGSFAPSAKEKKALVGARKNFARGDYYELNEFKKRVLESRR